MHMLLTHDLARAANTELECEIWPIDLILILDLYIRDLWLDRRFTVCEMWDNQSSSLARDITDKS